MDRYTIFWMTAAVIGTFGLYSVLYRENKFYRLVEHIFVGLASGWALVALWTETLKGQWYDRMVGSIGGNGDPAVNGNWLYALLLPIGLMGYLVYNRKHNWISRIPIGIILGLWSGQQIQVWWNRYGGQIDNSLRPIFPTRFDSFTVPSTEGLSPEIAADIAAQVYPSQVITNAIFTLTLISVLSYFLFSFDVKHRLLANLTTMGRWLLMIGFGAIFGSTVMMRFTLLIDRMYFVWIEWLRTGVLPLFGGGAG